VRLRLCPNGNMRAIPLDLGGSGTPFLDAVRVVIKGIYGRGWHK